MQMLLLLIYLILLKPGQDSVAIRQFKDEYPGVTVCESTLSTDFEHHMPYSYMRLKANFGGRHNCTHIEGNLVIQNVWENPIDFDLSFLESITEVTGMVYMRNNSISTVILPNLRVIRGDSSYPIMWKDAKIHPVSLCLYLINETNSNYAIFPSLRVISKHSVYFESEKMQTFLPSSVSWTELFENPKEQRLLTISSAAVPFMCHPTCVNSSQINILNRCWSNSPSHCQPMTKCRKSLNTDCHWCHFNRNTPEICCDDHCSGGCSGNKLNECSVCKNYIDGDKCVESCPREFISVNGVRKKNRNFKLRVGTRCAMTCPSNLLQQGDSCLYKCTAPQYRRIEDKCVVRENASILVEKECNIRNFHNRGEDRSFFMTKEILENFTDCEHIIGEFHFTEKSFNEREGGITVPMLYQHLRKVKIITGDLLIDGSGVTLGNLTFLDNLVEIRHHQTESATASLNIFSTDITFLGLRHLRRIYGSFEEHNNSALCFANTLPWKEYILQGHQFDFSYRNCNKSCHDQCGSLGCWGPSSDMCFECSGVRVGIDCVSSCENVTGYFTDKFHKRNISNVYDDNKCQPCHYLCQANCTGPLPEHCLKTCRYYMEEGECVHDCSGDYYHDHLNKKCIKCNSNCIRKDPQDEYLCYGNKSTISIDGCLFCDQFIKTNNSTLECYNHKSGPSGYYPHLQDFPKLSLRHARVWTPCTWPCTDCLTNSLFSPACNRCAKYWSDRRCVEDCGTNVVHSRLKSNEECLLCDKECQGCHAPQNASGCIKCSNKKFYTDEATNQFICMNRCPMSHNYSRRDVNSGDFICRTKFYVDYQKFIDYRNFVLKMIFMIPGPILVLLVCVSLVIARVLYKRNKNKSVCFLKAIYSNIQEPDSRALLQDKKSLPNMNRLLLIPTTNLIFDINDKPLGTGAFGAVYRGVWKLSYNPHVKKENNELNVAIKVIQSSHSIAIEDIFEEAKVMASVRHKHCLRLIGVCLKYEMPCLVTSFVELGSLDKYLKKHKSSLSSFTLLSWVEQIANGMTYLEMRGIIHRDLASRNVLLNSCHLVQITDFGLSHILKGTENNSEIVITSGQVPIRWLALETLTSGIYSHKTDVWAFGVTMWEICTFGQRPYDDMDIRDITGYLLQNNRLPQPEICAMDLFILMTRCWLESSQLRPSFEELMTTLSDYSRHSTYYLNIENDPCLTNGRIGKQSLLSQYSYELHQYPNTKGVYKQHSMDGTISTFIGEYQDDITEPSLRRQSSGFSWNSSKFKFPDETEKKVYLIRQHSTLSEDTEESDGYLEPKEVISSEAEYLEPIKK